MNSVQSPPKYKCYSLKTKSKILYENTNTLKSLNNHEQNVQTWNHRTSGFKTL